MSVPEYCHFQPSPTQASPVQSAGLVLLLVNPTQTSSLFPKNMESIFIHAWLVALVLTRTRCYSHTLLLAAHVLLLARFVAKIAIALLFLLGLLLHARVVSSVREVHSLSMLGVRRYALHLACYACARAGTRFT
jgi:hypothetical protein